MVILLSGRRFGGGLGGVICTLYHSPAAPFDPVPDRAQLHRALSTVLYGIRSRTVPGGMPYGRYIPKLKC